MIKIRAIVLAAGYATRLYPLTENQPKPLLNVGDKPIVEHITDKIAEIKEIKEIFVVTNHKFYPMFKIWLRGYKTAKSIEIIDDGTLRNDDRLGAIGDLNFVLREKGIKDDVLMIAGDNLFGFDLRRFLDFFKEKEGSVLAFCDLKEKSKAAGRFGVGVLDEEGKVVSFEEKPVKPRSSLAATCCYIFSRKDLGRVPEYIRGSERWDNPGDFARWLIERDNICGFVFKEYWFDIGSFEMLEEASRFYEKLKGK